MFERRLEKVRVQRGVRYVRGRKRVGEGRMIQRAEDDGVEDYD